MVGPNQPYTKLDANQVLKQSFDESQDRLRVDATVSASVGDVMIKDQDGDFLNVNPDGSINTNIVSPITVQIDAAGGDNIAISDGTNTANVNPDGSLDVNIVNPVNVELSAADGDSSLSVGTEDGTVSGTQHVLKVGPDLNLRVKDEEANTTLTSIDNNLIKSDTDNVIITASVLPTGASTEAKQDVGNLSLASIDSNLIKADTDNVTIVSSALPTGAATEAKQDVGNASLTSIDSKLNSLGQKTMANSMPVTLASDQTPIQVAATLSDEPIKISGTIDGTTSGTEYTFVQNRRQQILAAHDVIPTYTYADFGTKNQRITRIEYTSSTFPGITVRRDFNYVLDGTRYRRTSGPWSII